MLTFAALPLLADPPQPVVVNAVTDRYRPLPLDQEKLTGLLASRMRANAEGYLELVDEHYSGSAPGTGTEGAGVSAQTGKLLEASVNAFEHRHDEHLKAVMDRLAKQVIAAQTSGQRPAAETPAETSEVQDLLVHKYDLQGLLAYYRLTGDGSALEGARKAADTLLKMFPRNSTGHLQYRRGAILIDSLANLYRYTEESRYLEFCRSAADAWLQDKEAHNDPTDENLAALDGLVELYRITGDESYFRPVPEAWTKIRDEKLSLTGSPLNGSDESKKQGEVCSTVEWVQLTLNLLRVMGEAQYAEQLERTIYNQLFAGQDPNTGAILRFAPLNGNKQRAGSSDVCASHEAEGLTLIPAAIWGRYGNGIAVLLYNGGRATFQLRRRGTVQLYSEATFPESGDFLLHVEPAHSIRFPLRLRVPAWTSNFTADVAGSHLIGKPGEFLTINREWKAGDTVKIAMDMTLQVITGAGENADQVAVQRGPQVLALARAFNPEVKDLAEAALVTSDASRPKLIPAANKIPANWSGDQAYTVAGEYQGKPQELQLVPFADAKIYRVWLKKPRAASGGTN